MNENTGLDLYVLVDRSGSMSPLAGTVVAEVNRLIATATAAELSATVTVVGFGGDEPFDVIVDHADTPHEARLSKSSYHPHGATPLYDAIAETLGFASRHQLRHRQRQVVVAVVTDGEENASTQHSALDVLGKIKRRRAAGWRLLYLGVGDVFADAARLGFDADEVQPWEPTIAGTRAAFATIAATTFAAPGRRHHRRVGR